LHHARVKNTPLPSPKGETKKSEVFKELDYCFYETGTFKKSKVPKLLA